MRGRAPRRVAPLAAVAALLAATAAGCATIPKSRYGVGEVRFSGVEAMSPRALEKCLVTTERNQVSVTLGLVTTGECNEPPFDVTPPRLELWSWPWADWPLFDEVALRRDRDRVERWYVARGYHDARVIDVQVDPPEALVDDAIQRDAACDRRGREQGCVVDVTFVVEEGEPTHVTSVEIHGVETLSNPLVGAIRRAVQLDEGDRFDEALFEQSKERMREALGREGYALADVAGVARVDRSARTARLAFDVVPGPVCVFGEVLIEGEAYLPEAPIREAVAIAVDDPYTFVDIVDAQRAVYGLGAFSAVTITPILPEEGNRIDVRVEVTPAREDTFTFGVGIQAGELETLNESVSVPQWDVHLLARYRDRNLFGGMRDFVIEERPRLIVLERFPSIERPRFGNQIRATFRQPNFIDPRTALIATALHTYGPDPYDVFFRHRFDTTLALEREFLNGHLFVHAGILNSLYRVPPGEERQNGAEPPADSNLMALEQVLRLDYRDDPLRPHGGAFLQLSLQEAGYFLYSSWNYVRVLPDARVYVPLPWGITLAARFALGMLFITSVDPEIDPPSALLGPRDYRLRGGGASSNRGFLPGTLGDGDEGGTRRWEASLELRVPIGNDLGVAVFGDMGDVSREERFRFDHPQTAAGFGLRYYTIVGAVRADFAWKLRGLQVLADEDERLDDFDMDGTPDDRGGSFVFHLTIGQAF